MKAWLCNAVVTAAVAERLCPQLRIDCLQLALQCRSYDRSCGEIVSAVADRLPAVADRLPAVAEEAGRVSLRCIVRGGTQCTVMRFLRVVSMQKGIACVEKKVFN